VIPKGQDRDPIIFVAMAMKFGYLGCKKGTIKHLKNTGENNAREEYIRLVTIYNISCSALKNAQATTRLE